jgi:outer membrane immunogenic protein
MKATYTHARTVALAAGVAILAAIPARAADVVFQEPPAPAAPMVMAPVNTWSGPYAGVMLNYGFSSEVEGTFNGAPASIDTKGFGGSAFGGWNWQNGALVYGLEADIGAYNSRGDNGTFEARNTVDGSLRGRLGYAITDNVLVYGTAGGAAARQRISDATSSDTDVVLGYTAGVGVDARLTDQVFGRLEYRHTRYDDGAYSLDSGTGAFDNTENRVGVGLGIKF